MADDLQNSGADETPADDLRLASDRFWEENKILIIVGGVMLVLIGIAASIWLLLSENKRVAAQEAFANAQTIEQLQTVAKDFVGTVAADNSLLLLAKMQMDAGDTDAATKNYQSILAQKNYPLQATAALAEAETSTESEGFTKRATAMRELALSYSDSYIAPYALLLEGEFLLNADAKEDAVKVFQNLLKDYPTSLSARMAGLQANRLSDQSSLLTPPTE
ncbi:MAG: tetratricopeptide repeat protein [Chthoniobacterales bacterium]